MWDSELTLKLAYRLLPQIYELCRVSGQALFDASRMTYSQLVEWLLIRKSFEHRRVVPGRPGNSEIERRRSEKKYEGGYVHLPKEGIHDSIADASLVLDDEHSLGHFDQPSRLPRGPLSRQIRRAAAPYLSRGSPRHVTRVDAPCVARDVLMHRRTTEP